MHSSKCEYNHTDTKTPCSQQQYIFNRKTKTKFRFRVNCRHETDRRTDRQIGCNFLSPRYRCTSALQQECALAKQRQRCALYVILAIFERQLCNMENTSTLTLKGNPSEFLDETYSAITTGVLYDENCTILTSAVLTDPPPRRRTDRHTDGRQHNAVAR